MPRQAATLSEARAEFERYLFASGKKANTMKNFRTVLNALERSAAEVGGRPDIQVGSLTHHTIDHLFVTNEWGPATFNNVLTNLRTFFRFCRMRRYMAKDADPTALYSPRKRVKKERTRIPVDEWPALWNACSHPHERGMFAFALFTFVRGSELSNVKIKHLDLAGRKVTVYREKTGEEDTLPICEELEYELRLYLTWYTKTHGTPKKDWYLFPAREKRGAVRDPDTNRWVPGLHEDVVCDPYKRITRPYNYIQQVLTRAGYPTEQEGVHTLRRSGARALFDSLLGDGYDGALRLVQSMLGHEKSETTQIYLGITLDKANRDRLLTGKPMFAGLGATLRGENEGNVVTLHKATEEAV